MDVLLLFGDFIFLIVLLFFSFLFLLSLLCFLAVGAVLHVLFPYPFISWVYSFLVVSFSSFLFSWVGVTANSNDILAVVSTNDPGQSGFSPNKFLLS